MQDKDPDLIDTDEALLSFEIQDVELERAAGSGTAVVLTVGNCTYLVSCPA